MLYVIDDAADYRFIVQQVFRSFLPQYSVRLFSDGLELIRHAEQLDSLPTPLPALIIMDIDMPKMDGFVTLERLKQNPNWQGVPVVMMSNRSEAGFVETARELGAVSYLNKPMNLDALKDMMEQLCRSWIDR